MIKGEDCKALRALAEQLQTQHNDYTSHPIFLVQREVEVAGFSTEYTDQIRWFSADDHEPASTEEHAQLEAEYEENYDEEPEGWTRTGVRTHWETVQSFLTREAAAQYMESNLHNLGKARVYTDSAYRNFETQLLQRTIPQLSRLLQMFEDAGGGEHNVLALLDHYQNTAIAAEAAMFKLQQRVEELKDELLKAREGASIESEHEMMEGGYPPQRQVTP